MDQPVYLGPWWHKDGWQMLVHLWFTNGGYELAFARVDESKSVGAGNLVPQVEKLVKASKAKDKIASAKSFLRKRGYTQE